ncbi:uncharacterized protein LOC107646286 [Arachis ipaensis]|uniref:uncharacterized protein LOC107646286 n=1 Tax=Arachis ipaensis TaxID=130454 RepID=UPI0007AFBA4E|nr:uncharacterized protein LOC107646286 [Arachis ipaensis]XP_025663565.1 uncharacterized protein LOC112758981 [Arachis hypogaea]
MLNPTSPPFPRAFPFPFPTLPLPLPQFALSLPLLSLTSKLSSTLSVTGLHFGAAPIVPPQPSLSHSQYASSHHHKIEVLSNLAVQISHFPTIFKHFVNRLQPSVANVFVFEPAALVGPPYLSSSALCFPLCLPLHPPSLSLQQRRRRTSMKKRIGEDKD